MVVRALEEHLDLLGIGHHAVSLGRLQCAAERLVCEGVSERERVSERVCVCVCVCE